jgi:ABC-2 type transport system permease protein
MSAATVVAAAAGAQAARRRRGMANGSDVDPHGARRGLGPLARTWCICKRELGGYFSTPVAYVFIVIFLVVAGVFTFELGGFYERGQADLQPFFAYQPWMYLFLLPAISMRLWAEERKQGTLELLMTLPIPLPAAVLGKFLAAWAFATIALVLTFPIWITVSVLGKPDQGAILTAYIGSALMAGGFLAIGSVLSALTKNQVIAFVLTVVACFVFLISGYGPVINFIKGWAPQTITEAVAGFSFLTRFESLSKGVLELRDLIYFGSLIAVCLVLTAFIVDWKKAG